MDKKQVSSKMIWITEECERNYPPFGVIHFNYLVFFAVFRRRFRGLLKLLLVLLSEFNMSLLNSHYTRHVDIINAVLYAYWEREQCMHISWGNSVCKIGSTSSCEMIRGTYRLSWDPCLKKYRPRIIYQLLPRTGIFFKLAEYCRYLQLRITLQSSCGCLCGTTLLLIVSCKQQKLAC